ncbi:MAG: Jag N-terminal domain-containing protein, partial [Alkalispirochaeta sp.]
MVSMEQLQAFMRKAAQDDKSKKYVNVSGETLDDALREAAVELGIPIKSIEYEILENGSRGVLGMGKRSFLIVAYPAQTQSDLSEGDDVLDMDFGFETTEETNVDGQAFVRLTPEGILLKVTPPVGEGAPVTERGAMQVITDRTREKVDTAMVAKAVKRADEQWIRIGDFNYNPANDAYVSCEIVDGEMRAVVSLTPPGEGGSDPSADAIRSALE